ncbi:MAG: hypothetical protein SLAVMIC_00190 [uncultured marine phage]|uniref:Uncharacterized protein n=1 Tax=uncultured marine phage TaxID=707152 RepID=A0A8D9CDP6_9VIRU|nr:MAG: hypothetical protein SLAVMIC_00190 [uncultured marine phage]
MTRIVIGEVIIDSKDSIETVLNELEMEYKLISLEKRDEYFYHLVCEDEYGRFDIDINLED